MADEPLGLPKGSVRAIIALAIVAASVIAFFTGNDTAAKTMSPIAATIIGFYFGTRTNGGQ